MIKKLHPVAGIIAFLTILGFWLSTIAVELRGDHAEIAAVKLGILWGLLLLVPAIALAGASGFRLGGQSRNPTIVIKRKRMPLIAFNGIAILVPCAVLSAAACQRRAVRSDFYGGASARTGGGAVNLALARPQHPRRLQIEPAVRGGNDLRRDLVSATRTRNDKAHRVARQRPALKSTSGRNARARDLRRDRALRRTWFAE